MEQDRDVDRHQDDRLSEAADRVEAAAEPDVPRQQERNDFEPTENRRDVESVTEAGQRQQHPVDQQRDHGDAGDTRVAQPGEEPPDERAMPLGDIGETPRGQGQDRMGGYGNTPVAQEPGPDQDEGLNN